MSIEDNDLFDSRVISAINRALSGRHAKSIVSVETQVLEHADSIRKLDEALDGGLVQMVKRASSIAQSVDVCLFLVESFENDLLGQAVEMLETAEDSSILLDKETMYRILESANGDSIPVSWAVYLHGQEGGVPRNADDGEKKSSFSLESL